MIRAFNQNEGREKYKEDVSMYNGKLIGKNSVGRSRKRQIEIVQKDLAENQIIN